MPKLKNHIPKLCRHHKGQAFVKVGGQQIWLGRYGDPLTQEKYDRLIAQWLASGRALPVEEPSDGAAAVTVTELLAAYWTHAETYYCIKHQHKIKIALRALRRLYGSTTVTGFGPLSLQTVRQSMVNAGIARSTINALVNILRGVFKWGVANEIVPSHVHEALRAVNGLRRGRTAARETPPVVPAPDEHISAIRPHVSRQVWALIQLQLLTAARSGELVVMRPIDLDTSDAVWLYRRAKHKTAHHGHTRTIYISKRAQAIIRPFLDERPVDAFLISPKEAEHERRAQAKTHRRSDQHQTPRKTSRRVGDRYTVDSYAGPLSARARRLASPTGSRTSFVTVQAHSSEKSSASRRHS